MTDITRAPLPQRLLSACLAVWVAGALFAPATRADMPPRNEVPAVAIHRIQQPQDASDASPYAGETVSTEGIVVARDSIGYVLSETPSGPWRGLYVYDPAHAPELGHSIRITGTVTEYYGLTELTQIVGHEVLASALPLPEAPLVATSSLVVSHTAEAFESVLVRTGPITITHNALGHGEWSVIDAAGGACTIGARYDTHFLPRDRQPLGGITGTVGYGYGHYALHPRDDLDIADGSAPFALGGTILTPNEMLAHGYVSVQGTRIIGVGSAPCAGVNQVIETDGIVLPGLVNAHDHPSYNLLGRMDFGRFFSERYDWYAHPLYWSVADAIDRCRNADLTSHMWKLGELRHLIAGTTTLQGARYSSGWNSYAHPRILIHNAERLNPRIRNEVKPLNLSEASRERLREGIDSGRYEKVVIHLSEGINEASLAEFRTWRNWGLLDESTVLIHGIPLGTEEYAQMAAAGASLVWSPMSNLWLYDETADVPEALRQGVSVSLSTDWTLSGSYHLLDELKVASAVNQERYDGALTPCDLVRMVTSEPADQLGLTGTVGRLAPGHLADILVVRGDRSSPCEALIQADLKDVALTLVAGHALYGERDLMERFPTTGHEETIGVCSQARVLRIAIDAPWIMGADDTVTEITSPLQSCCPGLLPLNLCATDRCAMPLILSWMEPTPTNSRD